MTIEELFDVLKEHDITHISVPQISEFGITLSNYISTNWLDGGSLIYHGALDKEIYFTIFDVRVNLSSDKFQAEWKEVNPTT